MIKKLATALILSLVLLGLQIAPAYAGPTDEEFNITFRGQTRTVTLEDLGVRAAKRNLVQRTQNLFTNIFFLERAMQSTQQYEYTWYTSRSDQLIRKVFALERARNASYILNEEGVSIKNEVEGPKLEVDEFLKKITKDYPRYKSYTLSGSTIDLITAEELQKYFDLVENLLTSGFQINVTDESFVFPAQMKDISIEQSGGIVRIELNDPFKNYMLNTLDELIASKPSNLTILEVDLSKVSYAKTEGRVKDGELAQRNDTEAAILSSLEKGEAEANAEIVVVEGKVINKSGEALGNMTLLATGISNFVGSPYGRDFNIRKGLNENYHSVVIPQGAEFSYNALLGPITYRAGWKGSLAIFGGRNLRTVPGGGLCQVSTTMYRAALNAGLEITRMRNHSLYVHYYAKYGDGLDATIFPGSSDLKFINNTPGPILIEAYDDGYDAIINFYGTDDGRYIVLNGPYTRSNQPEKSIEEVRQLAGTEILWEYIKNFPDGRTEREWLLSHYNSYVKQY